MSRFGWGGDQWFDDKGKPLSRGKLYFYESGTGTAKATYSNSAMTIANSNPVVLDAAGRQSDIFFEGAARLVIQSASGVQIDAPDPVYAITERTTNVVVVTGDSVVTVPDYDALLLIDSDEDYTTCNMLGFAAPGDGGGGVFYWDSASGATANIGTVVQPTAEVGDGRWLRVYEPGRINVRWFGATGGGVLDDYAEIVAATEVAEELDSAVFFPAGTYIISDYIPMLDGMRLIGEGSTKSVIKKASASANDRIINKVTPETQYSGFSMTDIGLMGDRVAQTAEVTGSSLVAGRTIDNIDIENCRFSEGRGFGLNFNICKNVRVVNNDFENIYRDMCAVWSSTRVSIQGNNFLRNDDDCISVSVTAAISSNDNERQTGINIQGNILTDTGGIRCHRGKNLIISENTIVRAKSSQAAIFVSYYNDSDYDQSNPHSALITNNVISDFIDNAARYGAAGSINNRIGIKLDGRPAQAGGLAAPPKELDTATGTLVAPYTYNYTDSGNAGTDPIPRMFNIKVSDNVVVRTLQSGVNYSDWGYGDMFTRLSGTGWTDPVMTESYMSCNALLLKGPIRTLVIQDNLFNASGAFGIWFDSFKIGVPSANLDLDDVHIIGNVIKNVRVTGVEFSEDYDGTYINVRVDSNIIDCDPDLYSTGRIETAGVLTGGWANIGSLVGINYRETIGCQFFRNVFRNCSSPFISAGTGEAEFEQNVIEGQPALPLFDVTNLGVGYIPDDARISKVVYIDSDPSSATYGAMLEYAVTQVGGASPPTQGFYIRGYFMPIRSLATVTKNGVSQAILGYKRLITGKNHVVGTDWQAVYVEL